ncbi:MAG: DNA-binding response regulator [Spirochaetales bacterium]|nr:DNA-binding response regulator [Spirochaetales bacterium]
MARILFIDDDSRAHRVLRMVLPQDFHLISTFGGRHGIEAAKREIPDLILLDIDLPDTDGIAVLKQLMRLPIAPPVVMLTALAQISLAVDAIRSGAADYLVKPFEIEKLTAVMRANIVGQSTNLDSCTMHPAFLSLVGESSVMLNTKRMIQLYAGSDRPVLITGESGTGKDVAAQIIHGLSERNQGPYIAKNCAAVPSALFESELYGSERGAFTDAVSRPGFFEQAQNGSLFLDEIGEMSPAMQVKLLRTLEEGKITRIGGSKSIPTDVRVITATNKKIRSAIEEGSFRSDLFYRISTLPLFLPPLRERLEDLSLLAAQFLREYDADPPITPAALTKLSDHSWPGNVRELKNVLERGSLFAEGKPIEPQQVYFNE